jgi:hypothetical protein
MSCRRIAHAPLARGISEVGIRFSEIVFLLGWQTQALPPALLSNMDRNIRHSFLFMRV